jgi:hypothetical protein
VAVASARRYADSAVAAAAALDDHALANALAEVAGSLAEGMALALD